MTLGSDLGWLGCVCVLCLGKDSFGVDIEGSLGGGALLIGGRIKRGIVTTTRASAVERETGFTMVQLDPVHSVSVNLSGKMDKAPTYGSESPYCRLFLTCLDRIGHRTDKCHHWPFMAQL